MELHKEDNKQLIIDIPSDEFSAELWEIKGKPHLKISLSLSDIPVSVKIIQDDAILIYRFIYTYHQQYIKTSLSDIPVILYLGAINNLLMGFEIDLDNLPGNKPADIELIVHKKEIYKSIIDALNKLAIDAWNEQKMLQFMNYRMAVKIIEHHLMKAA